MVNDEFHIPDIYTESEIRAQIDAIEEYVQPSPEREVTPYQRIKAAEAEIFALREKKLTTEKKPRGWLSGLVFRPQNNTLHNLIEKESEVGGALFGPGCKFWLDIKSNETVFHNDVADWYYMVNNPANPKKPIVLRFQTTPQGIHKLYDGREYEPTPQEIDTFIQAVEAYTSAVSARYVSRDDIRSRYDLAA